MPRITSGVKPPQAALKRYRVIEHPHERDRINYGITQARNLQICTCGHDRCCHSSYLGTEEEQVLILNCPSAGRCGVKGCKCPMFIFASETSPEGKKQRAREMKLSKVFPPEEK